MFSSQQNFGSGIARNNPFANSLTKNTVSGVKNPYTQNSDRTRSAFARALTDQSRTEMGGQYEKARRDLELSQQKARAEDVQSQRRSQLENFSLDTELDTAGKKLDSRRRESLADIASQLDRAKKDYKVARLSNLSNLMLSGGLIGYPSASALVRAWNDRNRTSGGGVAGVPSAAFTFGSGLASGNFNDFAYGRQGPLGGLY